jgi:hypothetical protein
MEAVMARRKIELLVEFEADPDDGQLDDLCSEAESLVTDVILDAYSPMADIVRDAEVGQ